MSREIAFFVDWQSTLYGALRPEIAPVSWTLDPEILGNILVDLRGSLDLLLIDRDVVVETYLYGGFTETDGSESQEYVALTEALSRNSWAGRQTPRGPRFRNVTAVTSVLPDDNGARLHALHRSRLRVSNPRLRVRGDACTCSWLLTTRDLLVNGAGSQLRCPECRQTKVEIETSGQKMVDTLMTSHIVHRAASFAQAEGTGEIWVLSDDSDLLPAACISAAMGIRTSWLRTRPLPKYGYSRLAQNHGITLREVKRV